MRISGGRRASVGRTAKRRLRALPGNGVRRRRDVALAGGGHGGEVRRGSPVLGESRRTDSRLPLHRLSRGGSGLGQQGSVVTGTDRAGAARWHRAVPVSYTHLTLPT